jgi:hypothetical protein
MYTVLLTNGSHFLTRESAEKILDSLRSDSPYVEVYAKGADGRDVSVLIDISSVLTLIAHDTQSNPLLEQWRARRRSNIVSLDAYVASRAERGVSGPSPALHR